MTSQTRVLGVDGTRLTLDGASFSLTGISFFNALYNPAFGADRPRWLGVFRDWGINALRVWCQWDFAPPRTFVDVAPDHSMYTADGEVRDEHFGSLRTLIEAADRLGMVVEVTLFSHEKQPNLEPDALERGARGLAELERGARGLAERLRPYRNVIVQLWNEDSTEWERLLRAVKATDHERLVTSSPGVANVLGDDAQNDAYDLLTPHTIRRGADTPFCEAAPRQIAGLIDRFRKPVLDDEPARTGPTQFGGIEGGTRPEWHVEQIRRAREVGGYPIYHHDMFQYGYGAPTTPPSGIPEPDWSPFHRRVFAYLRDTRPAAAPPPVRSPDEFDSSGRRSGSTWT